MQQTEFTIATRGQRLYEFTRNVRAWVAQSGVEQGLLTLFVRHTSCSLLIQENADPEVQDDLLDIEGDTRVIGKRQGSDAARAKPTYPALLGVDGARARLAELLDNAQQSLAGFGPEADPLRAMADYVVARNH